jgi:hypothetical protein
MNAGGTRIEQGEGIVALDVKGNIFSVAARPRRSKMKTKESDAFRKNIKETLEDADQSFDEAPGVKGSSKSKVECICPGCGKLHVMKIYWSGRGVPRKFCQSCRDRQHPLGDDK